MDGLGRAECRRVEFARGCDVVNGLDHLEVLAAAFSSAMMRS